MKRKLLTAVTLKDTVLGTFAISVILLQFLCSTSYASAGSSAGTSLLLNPDPQSSAMGDTSFAAVNSPAALLRNPAAMASLLQPKLSFSTMLLQEGMNYSFAAAAVPTEYGTFSVGGAYLNYGDVRGYDNNGIALQSPASADLQLLLSYALSIRKNVPVIEEYGSIGVSVKMLQSTLADYSSSANTVDVGGIYHVPFLRGLSVGAVYRNIGSSLQYVKRSCALPSAWTAGLSYARPDLAGLILAGDFTGDSAGVPAACSAGVSVSPVYPLTVRAGWKDEQGSIAAGFRGGIGLDFNDFSLNYAVSPSKEFTVVQNIGLDISFGRIVQPKYAYDYYLRQHYAQARQSFKKNDFIMARQQLEEILSMYPDHQPSKELLEKISEAIDEEEQQKSVTVSKWLRKANVSLSRNDILLARRYFGYVLGIDPENQEANDGMARVDTLAEKMQRELIISKNREKLIRLWDVAVEEYQKGEYVNAKEKFQELLAIDPDNERGRQYLEEIDGQLQKISALQINEMFLQGEQFYEAGNYREAMRYFGAVVTADPSRTDAQQYFAKCKKVLNTGEPSAKSADKPNRILDEVETIYNRAVSYYENGDYDEALRGFGRCRDMAQRNGFEKYTDNSKRYIATIRGQLAEHSYNVGYDYFQKNMFEQAAAKYRKALEYNPNYSPAKTELEKIGGALAEQLYEQGMKEFAAGNTDKAKELIKKALTHKPDMPEALRALERMEK